MFNANYVAKLAARDPATETHFANYFTPLLTAKIRSRLRSGEAAEDARQDILMRVLTNIRRDGGLERPDRLGAYVNAVSNHVLQEAYRDRKKHPLASENSPEQFDYRPDPESELVTSERRAIVHGVLEELNEKDRELLRAAFLEERDKGEICRSLGVDAGYLRVLLHRARTKFRSLLVKKMGAGGI